MFARANGLETSSMWGIVAWCLFVSCVHFGLPRVAWAEEPAADTTETSIAARPGAFAPLVPARLPVSRHVDIGAAVAFVHRLAAGQTDPETTPVRYPSAIGVGLSARVDVWRYLRANLYVLRSSTTTNLPVGAVGLSGDPGAVPMTSYSFGLRLSPTLPLGPRARTWLTFGAGWGRFEFGRFDVIDMGKTYQVRERVFSFVEIPMGIGTSFDIIENWLAIEFEVTGAFHAAERGTALRNGQTIDTQGHRIPVAPFPLLSATFVQTLGLALVL